MQDFNKQNPEELSEEEQAKLARHSLIEYLSRRDNSKYELRQKLKQKGISKQIAEQAISHCEQQGYQSDLRYADMWIRSRANKGEGPQKIIMHLRLHGISAQVFYQLDSEFEIDWLSILIKSHKKKFKGYVPDGFKEKQKQASYLYNKGFDHNWLNLLWAELKEK